MIDKKKQVPMRTQPAAERIKNFKEVELGYSEQEAIIEAERCLQCKNPLCVQGCPVNIDIPGFIKLITEKKYDDAAKKIKESNSLPAICGRVCPQENQCEEKCILGRKFDPISIGRLERFASDNETSLDIPQIKNNNIKVAIVGAGPAGLTAASELAKMGYTVTVFEALNKPGGVLTYGIPEFRLPKKIVEKECDYIKKLGVEIKCNYVIGKIITIDQLFEQGYKAVFMGNGAGLPKFMNIPGENSIGVFSANEFLTRINLLKGYKFPEYDTPVIQKDVLTVIGGGNVAMDACRSAKRIGIEKVICVYRRTRNEMPARLEEVKHAEEEGIEFQFLTSPTRILCDDNHNVTHLECVKMELGEPDDSGRRRPVKIPGSEYLIETETIIIAIGQNSNPIAVENQNDIETNEWGYIKVDPETLMTTKKGVFAGGDIVTGAATVIEAMGAGKKAAQSINDFLKKT